MSTNKTARGELAHGAPGVLTLRGETFLISQPTLQTMQTVREWVKSKLPSPLQAAARDLAGVPPEFREAALKAAAQVNPGGAEVTDEAARSVLVTADGCRFLVWLMAKPNHPDLTLARLGGLIADADAPDVFRALDHASGMSRLGKEEAAPSSTG